MSIKNKINHEDLYWYKDAVIYELHIKAFCDSNGDGVGDFNGLISKLDYLQSLGVTAIWLLPFYPSPLKDDGYDIADYYTVNPAYGDIGDFKTFLKEAHNRNLKVITELVVNHTSDQHAWFQRARRAPKGSPERDYYVWTDNPHQYREVRIIFQDFEASNWTWDPIAQQYYWHRFFHHQPDLNYDNPAVQKEIFKILDYWCEMGVDGFRLDAVPYLFEREGTNCENLPETHGFLKKLRKHVDEKYPGTLLLAEANMWPEDSASYFGNGDECHMNYHFPVMPRMFMALQMEDKYPLTDIFDQTPEIPETCQWAMFLRNHDELTLEMVTDEERDYMYKVYTKDQKARINLGIRHRLAPLLDNNRKKIELLNYLLFSLPGTPVLYYGDEIGMGDNFYLGDRNGVRTPMQWSADRNAGFSECDSFKLYLPVILDPPYHYESVNVDVQTKNPSSLLWWSRRIINIRKKYKAFGRGSLQFINTDNAKVLAFKRIYQNETILVIANLSRYHQPAELDLEEFKGLQPVELFSKNRFPEIKTGTPYLFTIAPYDCQWYLIKQEEQKDIAMDDALWFQVNSWKEIQSHKVLEYLENTVLPQYLPKMRWFGGKSRTLQNIRITDSVNIPSGPEQVLLCIIEVNYQNGLPEMYQLPLTFEKNAESFSEKFPKAVLSKMVIKQQEGLLCDATFSKTFQQAILRLMSANGSITLKQSKLHFYGSKMLKKYVSDHEDIKSKALSSEQSNTSLVYDDAFFLKFYRKVDRAINPDIEITYYLTEKTSFRNIPAYTGSIEWQFENGTMVLGMLQEMVKNNGDAWTYFQHKLEHYNEKIISKNIVLPKIETDLLSFTPWDELPQVVRDIFDINLVEQAELIAKRTGEMHLALASIEDLQAFKPEEFSLHYQRSLFSGFQSLVRATFQNQTRALKKLPDHIKVEAEEIMEMKQGLLNVLKRIYRKKINAMKIRIHGDYHLGQVLYTGKDFVILDFEGEPARSYSERRLKRSPLRDVAGMVRSLHYAAYASLLLNDRFSSEEKEKLLPFAELWYQYMSSVFVKSYLEVVNGSPFIPESKEDLEMLLQTYILEKAIYEVNYELNNRPDWLLIPYRGIKSIMRKQHQND